MSRWFTQIREFATGLEGWHRDFILGLRTLRKSPVFCLTAILTLGLGIGANTAVFTLVYGLLLRSLPVTNAQQLARISMLNPANKNGPSPYFPYRMVQEYRRQQRSFTDLSTWTTDRVALEDADGALRFVDANLVSGNGFALLGMKPYIGHLIAPSDDVRGVPEAGWPVVLSYGYWKDHFGADPSVIGKTMKISDTVAAIIGVTPPSFHGLSPGSESKLYLPMHFFNVILAGHYGFAVDERDLLDSPNYLFGCLTLGRLRPGVSIEQANAEIGVHNSQLLGLMPSRYRSLPFFQQVSFHVESARTGFPSAFGREYSEPLYIMQGLVAVVLLLCCVNVGGLMMSKVHARRREFAVRLALGAAQWRLLRQFLTESFVLAAAGAGVGAALAWYGNDFLLHFFRSPMMGEWMSIQPDRSILLVTAFCALLTTVGFGLWPALRAGRTNPEDVLRTRTVGARHQGAARAFVPLEVALSVALVTVAMLLSQTLVRLRGEPTGFDVRHVTIQTAPFAILPQHGDAKLDLYQRMVDRIGQMPGVDSATVTWTTPMTGYQATADFQALTSGPNPPDDPHMAFNNVGPGYFRTMKTSILSGREFEPRERQQDVCVLNESAASFLFPHQQPIGNYVRSTDTKQFPQGLNCRVIGVAQDAKFGSLREPPPRTIYFPLTAGTVANNNLVFLINSPTKAQAIAAYRKALGEIAPTVPLVIFVTLEEQMDAALASERVITVMSNFFGGLALLLSAIGLYGLLASGVEQRTAEIGLRIALGAERRGVLWLILSDALKLVGIGVFGGGFILFLGVRFVRNMLYGVSAFDPVTLIATVSVLILIAVVAGLVPALRAASVDPMQALRTE